MAEGLFRLRLAYRIFVRKLRTLLQGPPSHPAFIRAAHYFADGWALNMLQVVDRRTLLDDLGRIKEDGFNTIILVIPWRGFQLDQLEPAYDSFYERQLRRVLHAADKKGLSVIVRAAYTYQILVDKHLSGITQAQRLLTDEDTRKAWLDYLQRLYRICHGYRCFRQGFISWEEFWHAFANWQLREQRPRRELAVSSGYLQYLSEKNITGVEEIPRPGEAGHRDYHAFTNVRIREVFEQAATVFPGLSMEFRVDKERIENDGEIEWVGNDDYSDQQSLRFSYWAPFMGAKNEGEKLSSAEAAHLLEYMLNEVSSDGRLTGHVVDQFNFVDEAPKFKGVHAEIDESQVADFLQASVPLLREKSSGYGVWAYRDYRQNVLYNARFLMGLRGWEVPRGRVRTLQGGGISLGPDSILRQYLAPAVAGLQRGVGFEFLTLSLSLRKVPTLANLSARINAGSWCQLQLDSGSREFVGNINVDFGSVMADGLILELRNDEMALPIEAVSLYHWIFRGGIRCDNGGPSRHHAAIRAFNASFADYERATEKDQTG